MIRWPCWDPSADCVSVLSATISSFVLTKPDGSIVVDSIDGSAKLHLDSQGMRCIVSAPYLVPGESGSSDNEDEEADYVTLSRSYFVCKVDESCGHYEPLQLALFIHSNMNSSSSIEDKERFFKHARREGCFTAIADSCVDRSIFPDWCDKYSSEEESLYFSQVLALASCLEELPEAENEMRAALEKTDAERAGVLMVPRGIKVDWEADATHYVHRRDNSMVVMTRITADGSWLELEGMYFKHHGNFRQSASSGEGVVVVDDNTRVYPTDFVPNRVWSSQDAFVYSLRDIATRAVALRDNAVEYASHAAASASSGESQPATGSVILHPQTLDVHEEQEVPGCGKFTAFSSGAVRAIYDDRTVVSSTPDRTVCEVVLSTGQVLTVNSNNPMTVRRYVVPVLQFAQWAFATPSERAERIARERKVQREILIQDAASRRYLAVQEILGGDAKSPAKSSSPLQYHTVRSPLGSLAEDRNAMVQAAIRNTSSILSNKK